MAPLFIENILLWEYNNICDERETTNNWGTMEMGNIFESGIRCYE